MSSVRIHVDGGHLGDMDFEVDDGIGIYDDDRMRALIDAKLLTVVSRVRAAYGIEADS